MTASIWMLIFHYIIIFFSKCLSWPWVQQLHLQPPLPQGFSYRYSRLHIKWHSYVTNGSHLCLKSENELWEALCGSGPTPSYTLELYLSLNADPDLSTWPPVLTLGNQRAVGWTQLTAPDPLGSCSVLWVCLLLLRALPFLPCCHSWLLVPSNSLLLLPGNVKWTKRIKISFFS